MKVPAILRGVPSAHMIAAIDATPLKDANAEAGQPVDLVKERYLQMALRPNLVCAKMEGVDEAWIGFLGEEPKTEEEWRRDSRAGLLGCGGRGFALVESTGEETVTHNLWSHQVVPYQYADMFDAQYIGYRSLSFKEERAHWAARLNPFSDVEELGWRTKEVA